VVEDIECQTSEWPSISPLRIGPISPQHYAFLVSEEDFDGIFTRIQAQGIPYGRTWDGPLRNRSTTTTADLA
jgi:hypothetical protein